jgi:hypothetical protein
MVRAAIGGILVHHRQEVVSGMEAGGTANQGIGEGQGRDQGRDLVQDHFLPEEAHLDVVEEAALQEAGEQEDLSLAVAHLAAVLSVAVNPLGEEANLSVEEVLLVEEVLSVEENLLVAEAEEAALPEVEVPEDANNVIITIVYVTLKLIMQKTFETSALKVFCI